MVFEYKDKPHELKVNIRIRYLDFKKDFSLDDLLLSLDSLDMISDFMSLILQQVEIVLDFILDKSGVIVTKKTPLGFTLQLNAPKNTINDTDEKFAQLLIFASFISKSIFTSSFAPPTEFIDKLNYQLQTRFTNWLIRTDSDPNLLLKMKEFENKLQTNGLLSSNGIKILPDSEFIFNSITQKGRLDVLLTTRNILLDEEVNTVLVNDSTERGGLSGLLGKKYGSLNSSKKGQNQFFDMFKLDPLHISHQVQSIVEIIYSLLNQMVPENDAKK